MLNLSWNASQWHNIENLKEKSLFGTTCNLNNVFKIYVTISVFENKKIEFS
jgi:hypothetical protein